MGFTGRIDLVRLIIFVTELIVRLFAGVNMFGVIFVFSFLPETKGKSLKEIEDIFSRKELLPDLYLKDELSV